eukprot:CAMPEP_0204200142 /NCGR_PEP_ID=MMETSP0361-20130328/66516_1 /ASSEMBLY_ACC=CAM_ASM_000343 /TAXON_ID=268821 /ORGANISM="Scrippsiella Hangoei, Strain SHTV-5" /LENGTH=41 /DNA_ID= /DNA_START= /DNA_END= /DNA_ORIENTATION=
MRKTTCHHEVALQKSTPSQMPNGREIGIEAVSSTGQQLTGN